MILRDRILRLLAVLGITWPGVVIADELADFRYQRPIEVKAPGWVGVRLDGEAQIRLPTDLAVLDPQGEIVLFWTAGLAAKRDAQVLSARSENGGWSLEFDLGPQPQPHRRLYFEVAQWINAPDCQLAGSDDRRAWQALGTGDLFRFGTTEGLQQQALDYQESHHRYLKLSWAGGQEPPRIQKAEVATADHERDQLLLETQCQPLAGGTECELLLPRSKAWIERLDLTLEGSSPFGFHLWAGDGNGWRSLQRGVRRSAGISRVAIGPGTAFGHTLPAGHWWGPLPAARYLRLEIYGEGVSLESARAWLASSNLVFEAETAGTYQLAYGRSAAPQPTRCSVGPDGPIAWTTAGEEQQGPWPPWPDRLVAPRVNVPESDFHKRWRVMADAAKGDVVRLELPDEGFGLARVRLVAAQKQVPFVRRKLDEPRLVERHFVVPESRGDGQSEVLVPLGPVALDASLQLLAPGPFERRVTGQWQAQWRPGVDSGRRARLPSPWMCNETPPLRCQLTFSRPPGKASELRLTFHDAENPPLARVRVEHWAPSHELWFVWPGEPVELYSGVGLSEPSYDISRLERLLLLRPATQASLSEPEELRQQLDLPSWALWLALGLAAVVLVWQLNQVLRTES